MENGRSCQPPKPGNEAYYKNREGKKGAGIHQLQEAAGEGPCAAGQVAAAAREEAQEYKAGGHTQCQHTRRDSGAGWREEGRLNGAWEEKEIDKDLADNEERSWIAAPSSYEKWGWKARTHLRLQKRVPEANEWVQGPNGKGHAVAQANDGRIEKAIHAVARPTASQKIPLGASKQ